MEINISSLVSYCAIILIIFLFGYLETTWFMRLRKLSEFKKIGVKYFFDKNLFVLLIGFYVILPLAILISSSIVFGLYVNELENNLLIILNIVYIVILFIIYLTFNKLFNNIIIVTKDDYLIFSDQIVTINKISKAKISKHKWFIEIHYFTNNNNIERVTIVNRKSTNKYLQDIINIEKGSSND